MVAESERLILRQMGKEDFENVAKMLRDSRVMYAWEHTFTDQEIYEWIERREKGYRENGFDYFLAIDKHSGEAVGQIGLLLEEIEGEQVYGLGWILAFEHQGKGYAAEGAKALADYAFKNLGITKLVADIRPSNLSSIKVAEGLGMKKSGSFIKNYMGKEMEHYIYTISN